MRKLVFLLLIVIAAPMRAEKATFAGGCFWCMEALYQELDGVSSVVSGYMYGREVVEVAFDPSKITYGQLVDLFWRNIDPLDDTGQFCDKGDEYRAAIFWHGEEQRRLAELSRRNVRKRFGNAVTHVIEAGRFQRAQEYHQDYYKKNPVRYRFYRAGCGRDARLKRLWGR